MPDEVSPGAAIPDFFNTIKSNLTNGERLLSEIPPDQMPEQVAKALDQFTISLGLLATLQSAVNEALGENAPSLPANIDSDVGRSAGAVMFRPGQDGKPERRRRV